MNSVQRFISVSMIAQHVDRHPASVLRAMYRGGVIPEKVSGAQGFRLTERDANLFVLKHCPKVGPLPKFVEPKPEPKPEALPAVAL